MDTVHAVIPADETSKPTLTIPVASRELVAVTGISKQGNVADVDFTWKWIPLNEIGAALYSGDLHYKSTVGFRDYDDGWRIVAERSSLRPDPRRRTQKRRADAVTQLRSRSLVDLVSSRWLTPRRLRAQAIVLALCLWGVCAVDFATPGLFDRAGNIKFQDFLQFSDRCASDRRRAAPATSTITKSSPTASACIVGRDTQIVSAVSLRTASRAPVSSPWLASPSCRQAAIWVTLSLLMYFGCIYLLWKRLQSAALRMRGLVALAAIAYPPLFHFFVRGQLSAVILACFTAGVSRLSRAHHDWLAGIALGFLVFKPQFLVAIPLVLLLAQSWKALAGLVISASAQLAFAQMYFGPRHACLLDRLLHIAGQPGATN